MYKFHDFDPRDPAIESAGVYDRGTLYEDFNLQRLLDQHADRHCQLLDRDSQAVARCSLWWNKAPEYRDYRVGLIGHFAAADRHSGTQLLSRACALLRTHACHYAIGPIDGSTWHHYRLVTEPGDEPAFFLEPHNPACWPDCFTTAGFEVLARYFSALVTDLTRPDPRIAPALSRLQQQGIRLRPLRLERFDQELEAIYDISVQSFTGNFLYTPISRQAFKLQYQAIKSCVEPGLTLLAEHENNAVGFVFSLPDQEQRSRQQPIDTVIIKTVAVLPGRRYAGLGTVLVAEAQRLAGQSGYRRVIHALMHEHNRSRNISRHYGKPIRHYALFGRKL